MARLQRLRSTKFETRRAIVVLRHSHLNFRETSSLIAMVFPLNRFLSFFPGGFLVALSVIAVEYDEKECLVLNADGWLFEFDKASQTVSRSGKVVALFRSVKTVDVEHFVNGKRFEWWVISLTLLSGERLFLGRSTDGVDVSIAAAHAATLMNKDVKGIDRVGI